MKDRQWVNMESDTAPRDAHERIACGRVPETTRYVTGGGRGAGHSGIVQCSTCGRRGRYLLNYLSGWSVECDGKKFSKVRQ